MVLEEEQLVVDEAALMKIVREYTREAGVRNLEQQVAGMNRKAAKKIVSDPNYTGSCNGRKLEGLSRTDQVSL